MRPVSSVATVNEFVTNLGKTLRGLHGSFSQFGSEELRQRFEYAVRALEISRQSLVEVRGFVLTDSLQCRLDDLQVSLNRIQGCLKALQTRAVDVEKLHTKLLCRLSNRRLLNLYVAKSDILSTMKIMHTFRSLWNRMHDEEWLIENAR